MGIVINTPPDNVAFSIALGVLLLSVVLHPIVRLCFHRIRADRAWRGVEQNEPIDVTKYNIFSEALGDRGRWDTARVVTLLLAAFHVSTWGLELSLDLALRTDGPVDLLNRPPPVISPGEGSDSLINTTDWVVSAYEEPESSGTLETFEGTLLDGNASTAYRIEDDIVKGNTLFAWWSPESARVASGLHYDMDNGRATVDDVSCSLSSRAGDVYLALDSGRKRKWGRVTECESGPRISNATSNSTTDGSVSPPTILLNSTDDVVHLIVEEASSYPSFLYSVWTPVSLTSGSTQLEHVFYIASTTRLVEAIVTGIVNGIVSGGGCVDLLTQFSLKNTTYKLNGATRVSPFGEHPSSSSVDSLDQVEPIVAGVLVSNIGTMSGVLLIAVTLVAFIGCLCCRSRKALDVYNRDELIRAISLPGGPRAHESSTAVKIYVKQEPNKAFSIVISDDGVYRGCDGLRRKLFSRIKGTDSRPLSQRGLLRSSSVSVPAGSRSLTFDGVRPTVQDIPARNHAKAQSSAAPPARRVRTVELIASPVPQLSRATPSNRDTAMRELDPRPHLTGSAIVADSPNGSELASGPSHTEIELRPVHVLTPRVKLGTALVDVDLETPAPAE